MKKRFSLIICLAAALTTSAWRILLPGDDAPQLIVPLSGVTIPEHRKDPVAKAQKLVSFSEAGQAELFRVGGHFGFSPVDGVSLTIEVEGVQSNGDGSLLSQGTVMGEPGSVAVFSEVDGAVAGSVELADGRLFTVNYVAPGVHRTAEVDFTTGVLDCGSCDGERPKDLPQGMVVEYDGGVDRLAARTLWGNLKLLGMRLPGGGNKISPRETARVWATGEDKINGLQAKNKNPGKSGIAQIGSKIHTTQRTGINHKIQSGKQ
ncbi:MAG: hypothetical protein QF685_05050 [Verrucomicrobiota bacterium]|jgi:hypothetical protein|nr:hypothetical protein [Verrucomicrobiota bacterium]